jgi:hypothetical protein
MTNLAKGSRADSRPTDTARVIRFVIAADTLPRRLEIQMNEDTFNLSVRKFLKMVGVSSQREIEHAVAKAIASGAIAGNESFPAKVTLEVPGLKLKVEFEDEIRLE